jgi:hypothetical protein
MPKENTHIYFANQCAETLNTGSRIVIRDNDLFYLYLGSIAPDIFFYGKDKNIQKISDFIHGKDGNLTNVLIFDQLKEIKASQNQSDLFFLFGFLTHCALDIIWHPIIYSLSGNYYSQDDAERLKAVYLHKHLETFLDKLVNKSFCFSSSVKISLIEDSSFLRCIEKEFKISRVEIKKALKRQKFWNKLFLSRIAFVVINFLNNLRIVNAEEELGLFYGNLKKDDCRLSNPLKWRDLLNGRDESSSIADLFKEAQNLSLEMIEAAFKFYSGEISEAECSQVISGKSLDTGQAGLSVEKMFRE